MLNQKKDFTSFENAYNQLDYTNTLFSNVEKGDIMNAKSNMLEARNLAMINQLIINSDDSMARNWRTEKDAWEDLSKDIQKFIDAKMEEQWQTGKTGTAGASYECSCRYNLAVARTLLLESLYAITDTIISDKLNLIDFTILSNTIPSRKNKEDIVADFIEYIDTYISNDFFIWENQVGSTYPQWKKSTANIIQSLKDDLRAYIRVATLAYPYLNTQNKFHLLWMLNQLNQIIRIGD